MSITNSSPIWSLAKIKKINAGYGSFGKYLKFTVSVLPDHSDSIFTFNCNVKKFYKSKIYALILSKILGQSVKKLTIKSFRGLIGRYLQVQISKNSGFKFQTISGIRGS